MAIKRLQFEAVTRAMWLMYAVNEAAVAKLSVLLSADTEQAAKNLPTRLR